MSKYEYVEQPDHYQGADMSAMDVIRAFELNFALGNVIKYTLRAGRKPDESAVRDLEKALWYLQEELAQARATEVTVENMKARVCTRNVDLHAMGARESSGEWGAVVVPSPAAVPEARDVDVYENELDAVLNPERDD